MIVQALPNLICAEHVFIDSTHVIASENKRKFEKKVFQKETRAYQDVKIMGKSRFGQINMIKKKVKRSKKYNLTL
jgi:hypothetical protein